MAKQVGPFKFLGKLGNLFGYIVDGEYYVRTIGKVDIEKRHHAPQYEETRQNEGEFGVATSCGQLFRQAMSHITKRWTTKHYTPKVMQIMLETLRSDTTHIKGQKSINCGLKNGESQMAFRRLEIFTKKNYTHYKGCLMDETKDPLVWKMNHQALWTRRDDGDTKSVKLGFLHIDFDGKIAKYEDAFTITCKRDDQIEHSEFRIAPSGEINLPWTFVIMQVWRDGDIQEPTGMLFMSVLQVVEGGAQGLQSKEVHGLHIAEVRGMQGSLCQVKDIVDKNGVDWNLFLDGYLGDGFDEWLMDDGELDGLNLGEDVQEHGEQGLLMEEVINEESVQRIFGEKAVKIDCDQGLQGTEHLEGNSEHGLNSVGVKKQLNGLGTEDLHTDEVVDVLLGDISTI